MGPLRMGCVLRKENYPQKGGSAMNTFSVEIDWRFPVALGGAAVCIIFALKMPADAAERVLTHAVDACQGYAIAVKGGR